MNILVIGSNGRTGLHVLEQGLRRGHVITAFTRRPETLARFTDRLTIVQGDGRAIGDLRRAVPGHDAVVMAVGMSDILRALVPAMHEVDVRRLVMTSSRSITATKPKLLVGLVWAIFRESYVDLARAEGMLEMSGLEWSIVRATMLNDKPFTGQVHTDFEPNATGGDWTLTRADYAMTLLDVAENSSLIGKALGVGGAKLAKDGKLQVSGR
jgi:putative NADH-flavin reductase